VKKAGMNYGETGTLRPEQTAIHGYEYVCNRVADLFMMFEPLSGRREVMIGQVRSRQDLAVCLRDLAFTRYPQAKKIVLATDNLNTHPVRPKKQTLMPCLV
jgi:hypothetical protein